MLSCFESFCLINCFTFSYAANLIAVSGAILRTFIPLPRQKLRIPPSFNKYLKQSAMQHRFVCTCKYTLSLSNGAVPNNSIDNFSLIILLMN